MNPRLNPPIAHRPALAARFLMRKIFVGIMLACASFVAARGQQVVVQFSFGDFHPDDPNTGRRLENETSAQLANLLHQAMPYWKFQSTGAPMLKIVATDTGASNWNLRIRLTRPDGSSCKDWNYPLFRGADLDAYDGLPASDQWKKPVTLKISKFLDENAPAVLRSFENCIPLDTRPVYLVESQNLHAVIPVKWEENQDLRNAKFLLKFEWPDNGPVQIYSVGLGFTKKYPPTAKPALQFSAIIIKHRFWQSVDSPCDPVTKHVADLPKLTYKGLYLEEPGEDQALLAAPGECQ